MIIFWFIYDIPISCDFTKTVANIFYSDINKLIITYYVI